MAALLGGSHPVFDLGECLLDGIEIGRVWRQEPEAGAGGADRIAYDPGLVAAEIVHDDDIARLEAGDQLLANIGQEAFAVDRTVEDARRAEEHTSEIQSLMRSSYAGFCLKKKII